MPIVADEFALEAQTSTPPNIAMRDAARFAHFLRRWHHDGSRSEEELNTFRQRYQHLGWETFVSTFEKTWRISTDHDKQAMIAWNVRHQRYLNVLAEKSLPFYVEHQRRRTWERRNPRPRDGFGTGYFLVLPEQCPECGNASMYLPEMRLVDGTYHTCCRSCRDANYISCEQCARWYGRNELHEHPPAPRSGSACQAPMERFRMPNVLLQAGYQPSDRIVTVHAEVGTNEVPITALERIAVIVNDHRGLRWDGYNITYVLNNSTAWEDRNGKLPKRFANALYKKYQIKLPADAVAEIGNIARQSLTTSDIHHVEFTRQLDQPRENFLNDMSCWWSENYPTSIGRTRCVFKQNGGMAMRIFKDPTARYSSYDSSYVTNVIARAWVVPLNSNLEAGVHDPMGAYAYLMFNAYGRAAFEHNAGQQMSALLASMLGMKHVKAIRQFEQSGMYVNDASCYVISPDRLTAPEVRMTVFGRNIKCSCVTRRDDVVQPYPYNDDDWSPTQIGGTAISEESDDRRGGGASRSATEHAAGRVFDDNDEEPDF